MRRSIVTAFTSPSQTPFGKCGKCVLLTLRKIVQPHPIQHPGSNKLPEPIDKRTPQHINALKSRASDLQLWLFVSQLVPRMPTVGLDVAPHQLAIGRNPIGQASHHEQKL